MDDLVKFDGRENFLKGGAISDIAMDKFKRFGQGLDFAEIALLEELLEELLKADGAVEARLMQAVEIPAEQGGDSILIANAAVIVSIEQAG